MSFPNSKVLVHLIDHYLNEREPEWESFKGKLKTNIKWFVSFAGGNYQDPAEKRSISNYFKKDFVNPIADGKSEIDKWVEICIKLGRSATVALVNDGKESLHAKYLLGARSYILAKLNDSLITKEQLRIAMEKLKAYGTEVAPEKMIELVYLGHEESLIEAKKQNLLSMYPVHENGQICYLADNYHSLEFFKKEIEPHSLTNSFEEFEKNLDQIDMEILSTSDTSQPTAQVFPAKTASTTESKEVESLPDAAKQNAAVTPRAATAKVATPKTATPKAEDAPVSEAFKPEAPKAEVPKTATPKGEEAPKSEALKPKAPKTVTVEKEAPKVLFSKPAVQKAVAPKAEAPIVIAPIVQHLATLTPRRKSKEAISSSSLEVENKLGLKIDTEEDSSDEIVTPRASNLYSNDVEEQDPSLAIQNTSKEAKVERVTDPAAAPKAPFMSPKSTKTQTFGAKKKEDLNAENVINTSAATLLSLNKAATSGISGKSGKTAFKAIYIPKPPAVPPQPASTPAVLPNPPKVRLNNLSAEEKQKRLQAFSIRPISIFSEGSLVLQMQKNKNKEREVQSAYSRPRHDRPN